jgi:tetratricopeptide (TPR) repeat protein
MNDTAKGKNTYKLIYEFNNDSSLFARLAASEIENKNYQNAIEILEKGIKKFPSYPTANFIYAIALAYQGKMTESIAMIKKTRNIFPCEETILYYLNKVSRIDRDQNSFADSSRVSFLPDDFVKKESFEDKLASIAEELKKARISITSPVAGDISPKEEIAPSKQIVSETMAKILTAQGNFKEAVSVYKELAIQEPAKADYYNSLIENLKPLSGN